MLPEYLRLIDTDTPGPRYDVTPLFTDADAFTALVEDLAARLGALPFELVAGIDALGFILGAALAIHTRTGFVPIRKGGKLPVPADAVAFVDYLGARKSLELRREAIRPGARVVLVDEWIETGAQVQAATALIEGQGGIVAGIATIHMDANAQTELLARAYRCVQVWPGDV